MSLSLDELFERYRQWGFCIIPIRYKDKKPLVPWEQYQIRKPDNAEMGEWFLWDDKPKNYAVVCGKISGNLVALDFDNELLFQGFESFWQDLYDHPLREMTPVVRSGGRGYHVYLRVKALPRLFHPSGDARKEIPDIQSEGGYVLLPPSLHPSGNTYELLNPECQDIITVNSLDDLGITNIPLYKEPEPKPPSSPPREQSEEFNRIAVEQILKHCAFIQHCQQDAATLSEPHWWSMVHCLIVFSDAGTQKIREFSAPYPGYSEKETSKKIATAEKALAKGIGPHTCAVIQSDLMFECPSTCLAKRVETVSPSGLASKMAAQVLIQQRTNAVHIGYTKKGKQEVKVNPPQLAEELMRDNIFKTFRDTEEVLIYQEGVYQHRGESVIKEQAQHCLLHLTTTRRVTETLDYVKRATYVHRHLFNNPGRLLNLENGLLDIDSGELLPHTPDYLSTIRIPVEYNPHATCPLIEKFLKEIVSSDNVPVLEELAGYCLEPGYRIHRAFLFVGDGANGKSTFIELLRSFLGKENCSTLSLQAIEGNRFAPSGLYGKLANMYADLPSTMLKHIGTFKMLTGADSVAGEKKFRDTFSFYNQAKLVFSTNKPPKIQGEDTYAFWRRWIMIDFPNQFTSWQADKTLIKKLTQKEELSGFLNKALNALKRLQETEDFSYKLTPDDVAETYLKAADPIYAFITDQCVMEPEGWISKDDFYEAYKHYCRKQKIPVLGKESFGRAIKNSTFANNIKSERKRFGADLVYGWKGIDLS